MHAENFLIDQSSDRQTVKNVSEYFPKLDRVAALALIIEPVNSVDLSTLVVTSQEEEVLRIFNLVAHH
jgi:hypothetical protein